MALSLTAEDLPVVAATTIVAITVTLALVYLQFLKKDDTKLLPLAPVGFFETLKKMGGKDAPFFVWEVAKKMGEVDFRLPVPLGNGGIHIIGDADLSRQIFMDSKTEKPRRIYKAFQGTGNKTLFSSGSDAYAKTIRKSVAHAFSKKEVERMNQIAMKHIDEWMNGRLKKFVETGEPFDPGYELVRLTFFIINEAAFEYQTTDEEFESFTHHAEVALREFAFKQMANPLRKIFGRFFLPEVRNAIQSGKQGRIYAEHVVKAYRENPNKSSHKTLIKILTDATCFESEQQRASEVLAWIFAGQDTTGYTIGNALTLLAKHPQEQSKMRQALAANPDMNPKEVPYFHHVVQEVKRLTPVAAMGSIRETGRDFTLKGDKVIPKGAVCLLNQFLCGRNPKLFDKPEEFRPQRWETSSKEMDDAMMYFGLGSRNCPGQYLAVAEINSLLPRILNQYSLELVDEGGFDYFITLKYVGSKVRAKKL